MAIINCPHCGRKISDKADNCVHCGMKFTAIAPRVCEECGVTIPGNTKVCPSCGCPVSDQSSLSMPNRVEVTDIKVSEETKSSIGLIVGFLVFLIIAAVAFYYIHTTNVERAYKSKLYDIVNEFADGGGTTETCANLIGKVWYNAIFETKDSETDIYVYPGGRKVKDFNEALANLYSNTNFKKQLRNIESNVKNVEALMKELKNPPKKYTEEYEVVKECYESFYAFTDMVLNLSGSYQNFKEKFSEYDEELAKDVKKLSLYLK